MARAGPRKIRAYSREFKLTAVRLSQQPGLEIQAVAAALDIHPFMLSKWRKQVRDGVLRGKARDLRVPPPREIRRLQELERAHALLQEEHELLKKGSSRISGERRADLEEEVGVVPEAVGHALDHFDFVVHALEHPGVERILTVRQDAGELHLEAAGERD
ncbi:MAG: transposase [Gemmatimonadetes bacterium]|nr:transposase [Gemmatimonadota bacterium]